MLSVGIYSNITWLDYELLSQSVIGTSSKSGLKSANPQLDGRYVILLVCYIHDANFDCSLFLVLSCQPAILNLPVSLFLKLHLRYNPATQ
jgi:hypothetical protein